MNEICELLALPGICLLMASACWVISRYQALELLFLAAFTAVWTWEMMEAAWTFFYYFWKALF